MKKVTFTHFTESNLNLLKREITVALAAISEKYGIEIHTGNINYTADQFTTKITATTASSNGILNTVPSVSTIGIAEYGGLKVGQIFKHATKTLKIVEFNANRPKNCVTLVDQNGKRFKCSLDTAKRMIK